MKKKLFQFFSFFFLSFPIFAFPPLRSVDLSQQKPLWQAVIGGEAVSPCIETSYGIAVVSDGRMLSACTNSGNVIWQRSIKGKPSKFISSFGDFLYIVTDSSKLSFINPSGATVWQADCSFEILSSPLSGKDGRVFVRGEKEIACYALDGKRKWRQQTGERLSFPLSTLKDGSVIAYLSEPKDGRTVAKRFSAFGEPLEDLTFSGIITSVEQAEEEILVSLSNGSIGLVALQDGNKADSKWVSQAGSNASGAFSIAYRAQTRHAAFFFQEGGATQAVLINVSNGKEIARFPVGNINISGFKGSKATSSGFFISGSYSACEFYEDGTILWTAVLPPAKKWKELCYTKANCLIFCFSDWSMNSYKMNSIPGNFSQPEKIKTQSIIGSKESYKNETALNLHSLTMEKMAKISSEIKSGNLGEKENEYLLEIKSEGAGYLDTLNSVSRGHEKADFYAANPLYTRNLLYLMSQCGTSDFPPVFAKILLSEDDSYLLSAAIIYSGDEGFDPDGEILSAYEYLIMNKISSGSTNLLKNVCDSTYKICRFMGRPAFNRQGKNILSHLMFPQFNKETREYARKTLEKMIGLEK